MRHRREAVFHARRLFEEAAVIDPRYARSYAGMSRTLNLAWRYRWTDDPGAALNRAVELAERAIEHDNVDARGFGELGFARLYEKRHDESIMAYERAQQLNPNDADILAEMADALTYWGDAPRAVELLKRAIRLNPFHPDWYLWYLGEAYFHLGDYAGAVATLNLMRDRSEAHRLLAASHALLGQDELARFHAQQVLVVHPNFSIEHWRTVPPDKDPAALEIFIEGLRRAGLR
jgi:tetratricopeptide (TPR) repeat protein